MDVDEPQRGKLTAAELGVTAHLYRGEVYRSTIWRTRLDTTTNWSVVTLGVALSITYSSPQASPLPLVLVGILIIFFLMLEARRYRYFSFLTAPGHHVHAVAQLDAVFQPSLHAGQHHRPAHAIVVGGVQPLGRRGPSVFAETDFAAIAADWREPKVHFVPPLPSLRGQ